MRRAFGAFVALLFLTSLLLTGCRKAEEPVRMTRTVEAAQPQGTAQVEKTSEMPIPPETPVPAQTAQMTGGRIPVSTGEDGVIHVLVIGNSLSYAWQDELSEMLRAADRDIVFYAAYKGGTTLSQHWEWIQNDEPEYRLRCYANRHALNENGVTLEYCLDKTEWDAISIQEAFVPLGEQDYDEAAVMRETRKLAAKIYKYIRSRCPKATLLWHQTWALEVGEDRGHYYLSTADEQKRMDRTIHRVGKKVVEDNEAFLIPTGTAVRIARKNGSDDLSRGDGCHDGTESGGQYLNACVWFECITGESCVGNTWRPEKYTLTEERIALLQNAAHQAVEEWMGP